MSYPELHRFEFHRNGHSNRRDTDAIPRVLCLGFNLDQDRMHFHLAGDEYVRSAHVFDAAFDRDLIDGMEPFYACWLGIEYQRAYAKAYGDGQEKTARSES